MCAIIQMEWTPEQRLRRMRSDWRGAMQPLLPIRTKPERREGTV